MNFHLESYFNESPRVSEIIAELHDFFAARQRPDGTIAIAPGCFVYSLEKLPD
ncbi:MAG: hypothetical protein Q8L01_00630 [Candidatus Woesebacteria bacterium]|nr:hypothetical protein [Candidatus Woesebacteria bacterium]